jgi:hypothetical protein
VSETVLKASISAADIASTGVAAVTVFNPAPGGGESGAVIFPAISFSPWKGELLTTTKVAFDWDDIAGAVEYKLQLSQSKDFSTVDLNITTSDSAYFHDTLLKFGEVYYWRIKYKTGETWSEWAPAWAFTAMDALSAPLLTSPDHKLSVNESSVTLAWQPVRNAATYRIVVARDSTFILKVKSKFIETTEVNFTLADGRYFWRVRAFEPFGTKSPWSEVRILKVYTVQ